MARWVALVFVGVVSSAATMAVSSWRPSVAAEAGEGVSPWREEVAAQCFRLVDAKGKTHGLFKHDSEKGTVLTVFDIEGVARCQVYVDLGGQVSLNLRDPRQVIRQHLFVTPKGVPEFCIQDASGKRSVWRAP